MSKKNRPSAPAPNPEYPTKAQLALQLMEQFRQGHSQITVKAVVADALYGQQSFISLPSASCLLPSSRMQHRPYSMDAKLSVSCATIKIFAIATASIR